MGASFELIGEICRTAGFSGLEGAPPLFEGKSEKELMAIRNELTGRGVDISSLHLPFSVDEDPASFYESHRITAVETLLSWIERGAMLGVKIAIIHPVTQNYGTDIDGVDGYRRQLGKSMKVLLPAAEDLDVVLAVENMLPHGNQKFGSQPEHMKLLLQDFESSHFGFCLDTGHALISAGPDRAHEMFDVMAPRLVAFHLADNPGDRDIHIAPGRGNVDWRHIFRGMMDLGYTGAACIEAAPFAHGPQYTVDSWIRLAADMDELLIRSVS